MQAPQTLGRVCQSSACCLAQIVQGTKWGHPRNPLNKLDECAEIPNNLLPGNMHGVEKKAVHKKQCTKLSEISVL
jgi:hypothetical protein